MIYIPWNILSINQHSVYPNVLHLKNIHHQLGGTKYVI